jgi:hypothetical protein
MDSPTPNFCKFDIYFKSAKHKTFSVADRLSEPEWIEGATSGEISEYCLRFRRRLPILKSFGPPFPRNLQFCNRINVLIIF